MLGDQILVDIGETGIFSPLKPTALEFQITLDGVVLKLAFVCVFSQTIGLAFLTEIRIHFCKTSCLGVNGSFRR